MKRAVWLIGLCAVACGRSGEFRPLQVGDAAPTYSATTMRGDTIALRALQGRPVLLNVWATWCIPCRTEMPGIQQLHTAFADSGLEVIAVSVDEAGSDADVQMFVDTYGIRFTVLRDPDKRVSRAFRTLGVPETFLVDRQGKIARRWIGEFDPASEAVKTAVRQALRG
jgi:cytochrome c-type biogenesis protein